MEIKFYEKIGVRQWKKVILWLAAKIIRDPKYRRGTNYYLANFNIASVRKFKKMLWFNTLIHTFSACWCIFCVINYIYIDNINMLLNIVCVVINLYCIMLQRYNWLRIKKVLNKFAHK